MAHAAPTTRIVYVGKRGGCTSTPQAFIEKLMLMAVHEGENVVRLKGGDPFIFGRGGEEVEHLRAAGVEVKVINGITAGLAAVASLGVPLTHREHAHGVIFLTGHARPGADEGQAADGRRPVRRRDRLGPEPSARLLPTPGRPPIDQTPHATTTVNMCVRMSEA